MPFTPRMKFSCTSRSPNPNRLHILAASFASHVTAATDVALTCRSQSGPTAAARLCKCAYDRRVTILA